MTERPAPVGLSAENVGMVFSGRSGDVTALAGVDFRVRAGEFVCLVGPSGCGKSTVLKLAAGLLEPTEGKLGFDGGGLPRTSMVFQDHGLFPWLSIVDNVGFGLEAEGVGRTPRRTRALGLLEQLGLGSFADSYPHQLSGGMQQRAAIARAMLTRPQMLMMDEPFSALDAQSKLVLMEELLRLWKDQRQTVVYVTHDIEEAVLLGDRVLIMSGRPGHIQKEVNVPLQRPRDLKDRGREDVRAITWNIWKAIEGQVRRNLHVPA